MAWERGCAGLQDAFHNKWQLVYVANKIFTGFAVYPWCAVTVFTKMCLTDDFGTEHTPQKHLFQEP